MSYWDHDTTFAFLELYKNHPCVWDPQHKHYKNKKRSFEAWIDIAENMPIACTVEELKKKKESLMTAYRTNKMKEQSGFVTEVCWFAFSYMDAFLGPIYSKNLSLKNVKNEDSITTDYEADDTRSSIEFETDETEVLYESKSQHEYTIQSTSQPRKRRYNDPLQLTDVKKDQRTLDNTEEYLDEQVLQEIHIPDDECATFGTLVAQKLRKLSDERRDVMMVKINQLFVDERQNNAPNEKELSKIL